MFAGLDAYCKEQMSRYLGERFPRFAKMKMKMTGALAGADVYGWKLSEQRVAWFIFGGYRKGDCDIIADIVWTNTGKKLTDIDYIDWRTVPSVYPEDGACKLVHRAVVADDFVENRAIEIAGPPKALQERALKNYGTSELFRKTVESRLQRVLKSNPALSLAEAQTLAVEENMKGSRPFFKLWSKCAESLELNETEMEEATVAAMVKVFHLLEKFGIPFLEARLS